MHSNVAKGDKIILRGHRPRRARMKYFYFPKSKFMNVAKINDNKLALTALIMSLLLTGLVFYVDEGVYRFSFLMLNQETILWILYSIVSWVLTIGVYYLVKQLKIPVPLMILLTFVIGFLPLLILIGWSIS